MLKRLLAAIGLSAATVANAAPPYSPYKDAAADAIYNLLFCDDPLSSTDKDTNSPAPWQTLLAAENPNPSELSTVAHDANQEGRVRALLFARLRSLGQSVPKGVLLGVVTEVGLPGGLDTLAAFSDGGVRYINQSAKMVIVEGRNADTSDAANKLLSLAQDAVNKLQPLTGPRWAPPQRGTVRFTFLTSDGLYLGQGPISAMQQDQRGAPLLQAATDLLLIMVKLGTK